MKNVKKSNVGVFKTLVEVFIELLTTLKYAVIEELGKIAIIVQIAVPVLFMYLGFTIPQMLIAMIVLSVITKYIKEVGYKLNNVSERGFPIPMHRYTIVDDNGFIHIKDEDMQEAILYLCDVENYLRNKGLIKENDTMQKL